MSERYRASLEQVATLLRGITYNLYSATLVGNPAPKVARAHERISDPQVGDFVVETSSFGRSRDIEAVGDLIKIAQEPVTEWDDESEPAALEKVYYIRAIDGRVHRWTNAHFISAIVEPFWREGPIGSFCGIAGNLNDPEYFKVVP